MTEPRSQTPALTVETRAVTHVSSLIPFLDARDPLIFVRDGDGIAGIGEALRLEFRGPDRIRAAAAAWRRVVAAASVDDPLTLPGTGLVAFGAFSFADESNRSSVLIVPRVIVGRRDGQSWVTRVDGARDEIVDTPLGPEYRLQFGPGSLDGDSYRDAVATAIESIRAGGLRKVVLARDLVGELPEGGDLRRVLTALAASYPDTWTFAIDRFLGSSPETLVRVHERAVSARVLAGSTGRGSDADADRSAALALTTSAKDLDEHGYAVRSVMSALTPHSPGLVASELPYALELPNLWHLASDIEGRLSDDSTSLDLVAELHPTAAVAGDPTDAALQLIRELEPHDRGLYGGPVGWVDAAGDGKWAIALRAAQVGPGGVLRAFAGAGIVAGSDPGHELDETRLKFRPIVEAFSRPRGG